jgi:hypothetical protein
MARVKKHHVINSSIAAAVSVVVSLSAWILVHGTISASDAASAGTYACFKSSSGQVYLRSTCKAGEKRVLINGTGLQGARGYSNFELAQQNGYSGTVNDWLKTLVGPAGSSGSGSTGATGATGAQGPAGPAGAAGARGADGLIPKYGSFYDTTDQTSSAAGKGMTLNQTLVASGVSIDSVDPSKLNFTTAGVYNIQFSAQMFKTTTGNQQADIWLKVGGVNVPWSDTAIDLVANRSSKTGAFVAAWNFMVNVAAGQSVQIFWSSSDPSMTIESVDATNGIPAIPGLIVTVQQVG